MPPSKVSPTIRSRVGKSAESSYSDNQLLLAARLYYVDGVMQNQIAKMVGVSQTKVSRMLAVARDRGIVQITVPEYEPRNKEIEAELRRRFSLKETVVIRAVPGQTVEELRHTLGYFASPTVSQWVANASSVAIAGGRTLEAIADHLTEHVRATGPTLIQAMGSVAATPGSYDASEIARKLSRRLGGDYLTLNTPAFLPNKGTCQQLLALKEIREVFDRLAKADIAFIGIGNLDNSVFIDRSIFKPSDLKELHKASAAGEILGRFFDVKGKECRTSLQHRVVSLPLEKLQRITNVVAVVVGADRAEALRSAIRGKLIHSVVVDENTAKALLL